jgi:hypothetical protein
MKTAIRLGFVAFVLTGSAFAQTPGMGETRPADPAAQERRGPADDAGKATTRQREPAAESQKPQTVPDAAITRCDQLTGALRTDCLRQERAAVGGTRQSEPATAPPPQNPR